MGEGHSISLPRDGFSEEWKMDEGRGSNESLVEKVVPLEVFFLLGEIR